jgi:hypothetical protein
MTTPSISASPGSTECSAISDVPQCPVSRVAGDSLRSGLAPVSPKSCGPSPATSRQSAKPLFYHRRSPSGPSGLAGPPLNITAIGWRGYRPAPAPARARPDPDNRLHPIVGSVWRGSGRPFGVAGDRLRCRHRCDRVAKWPGGRRVKLRGRMLPPGDCTLYDCNSFGRLPQAAADDCSCPALRTSHAE